MHISCAARGTGSARAAADYLVGERDSAGRVRPGIEVLRGNPDHVAAVADSLGFERRYMSLVIAWAPEDRPTDEQIGAVLDEFEKTAWAGLEPDRYAWTAVLHREEGDGVHVHILGADAMVVGEHPEPDRDPSDSARPDRAEAGDPSRDRGHDVGRDVTGDRRGALRGPAGRDAGRSALDRRRAACLEAVEQVRELYDRVRGTVDDRLGAVVRAVQHGTAATRRGTAAALRGDRSLAAANRAAVRGERDLASSESSGSTGW